MFRGLRVAPALLVLAFVNACGNSTGPGAYYGPPLLVTFNPTQVSQGNTASFTISLPTNAYGGGMPIVLALSGVGSGADTSTVPTDTSGAPLDGTLTIPGPTPDGTLTLTVSLPTLHQSAYAVLTIKDTEAPTVSVGALASDVSGVLFSLPIVGTTDSIAIAASDNHLLAWIGWTVSVPTPFGDSVPLSAASDSQSLPITIPASLIGDSLTVTVFAVDADGNRASTTGRTIVSALTTHPVVSAPRGGRIADVAFDLGRGVLYVAKPDSQVVDVLTLAGMTYQTPIAVSGTPVAIDLTPSGDSLVVGLASPAELAVVSLTSASHPVLGLLPFDAPGVVDSLQSMRVMADGRAVAIIAHPSQIAAVMSLDLSTGTSAGLDSNNESGCLSRITRSGDRVHAVAIDCGGLGKVGFYSVLYSALTHGYAMGNYMYGLPPGNNLFTSASGSGDIFYQFGHSVTDSTLTRLLTGGVDTKYGAAIAPNATDFYVGEGAADSGAGLYLHYFVQYGFPYQSPTEIAIIPHPPYELAVSPDASTLIGITADTISAIDLTHSTPATAAQAARVRSLLVRPAKRVARRPVAKSPDSFTIRLRGVSRGP